jgi:hypothetical protein
VQYRLSALQEEMTNPQRQQSRESLAGYLASGMEAWASEHGVEGAVIGWRAEHRGRPLPRPKENEEDWKSLYDLMFTLARRDAIRASVTALIEQRQLASPLRLVVTGRNRLRLYLAPTDEERDDRLVPFPWVAYQALKLTRQGVAIDRDGLRLDGRRSGGYARRTKCEV